jgi:hypothetical protein
MESVRVILCLAAHFNWTVHHMNVKTAFLSGELLEEVYVSQPPGFIKEDQKDKVLKMHKALYGLRQAPRAWNSKLVAELHKLGFNRCKIEYGLYTRVIDQQRLIMGVYIDDLVILGKFITEVSSFKTEMMEIFRMSDLGPLSYYLGIEVKQSAEGISLSQCAYATKLLEKIGMKDCNPCAVPMEPKLKLSKNGDRSSVDQTNY